jgi:type I restriction enzyme S subunit
MTKFPENWKSATLGEVCDLYQPKTISTKELIPDGKYPVYGANGQIGFYDKYNHEESEVTITCRGATCGTVNVIPPRAWITGNAMVCRPRNKSMSTSYLRYFLESINYSKVITGTAQPQITRESLSKVEINFPEIEQQIRIVQLLEENLSRLDAAMQEVEQANQRAKQFRNIYIDEYLKSPMGMKTNLGSILKFVSGFAFKSSVWQESGMPVVKIMNVKHREVNLEGCSHVSNEVAEGSKSFAVSKGDLLFNMTGATLGAFGFYNLEQEARMNQRVGKFVPINPNTINLSYFAYFLEAASTQQLIQQLSKGAAQPNISPTDILSIEMLLPKFDEQISIVEKLDAALSKVSQVGKLCRYAHTESIALRRSALHAAFTGQLTKEVLSV